MTPYINDSDFTLYVGDVRKVLAELPAESVHCVVTSPPYWGLRDYGTGSWEGGDPDCEHRIGRVMGNANKGAVRDVLDGDREFCKCGARRIDDQIGLEPTPDAYVEKMVSVFRQVHRVLRKDGTCWLNLGDSYNSNESGGMTGSTLAKGGKQAAHNRIGKPRADLKPKDLVGIPWMLAFALRADGWYLRSDIIWSKPNPMPESVTDRPTKAHEYLFLLTKSQHYYYDVDAIREPFETRPQQRLTANVDMPLGPARVAAGVQQGNPQGGTHASRFDLGQPTLHESLPPEAPRGPDGRRKTIHDHRVDKGHEDYASINGHERWANDGRNKRSVWEIVTEPYPEAHFAVFPQALVEPCVLAGTSEHGCCPECGAPWERETERTSMEMRRSQRTHEKGRTRSSGMMLELPTSTTIGWHPTCECSSPDLRPILTPTGDRNGDDPTMQTGRKGMNRPRAENEGRRSITRYEQARYAALLRASPARQQMEVHAGSDAFAHYIRTDEAGARPIPPDLLERWIENGWLERVVVPEASPLEPVPCVVMDPFMGSGTTAVVARRHGRHALGIELNAEYAELIGERTHQLSLLS